MISRSLSYIIVCWPDVILETFQMSWFKVEDMMCQNILIVHHKFVKSTHQLHYLQTQHNTVHWSILPLIDTELNGVCYIRVLAYNIGYHACMYVFKHS